MAVIFSGHTFKDKVLSELWTWFQDTSSYSCGHNGKDLPVTKFILKCQSLYSVHVGFDFTSSFRNINKYYDFEINFN